jgi:hypothetical protein
MTADENRAAIREEIHIALREDLRLIIREEIRLIIREELEPLRKQTEILDHHITGNGTPKEGIILRLFQLEQSEATRARALWLVAGVAIVSATATAWKILTGQHG